MSINDFRKCAQSCVVTIIRGSGCAPTDGNCLCNKPNLTRDSLVCLRDHSNCDKSDDEATIHEVTNLCGLFKVNLTWNTAILTQTATTTLMTSTIMMNSTGMPSTSTTSGGAIAATALALPSAEPSNNDDHSGRNVGIGVGVGIGVLVLILAGVAFWFGRRYYRLKQSLNEPAELDASAVERDNARTGPINELDGKGELVEMDADQEKEKIIDRNDVTEIPREEPRFEEITPHEEPAGEDRDNTIVSPQTPVQRS